MRFELSIVIVNFNTKEFLLDCLESIENERSAIKKEIIVVDNGSSDGSVEAIRNITLRTKLELITNRQNLGFAAANNQGIKKAGGEYICLLNSDTRLKKGMLRKLLKFSMETPDAGVVGPRLLNPDGAVQSSVFHFPTIQGAIREFWLGEKGAFSKYTPVGDQTVEVDAIVGAAMLIPRKIIEKIGLLDERYFMYYEDLDYCRRVRQAAFKIYYLPTAEIVHYHGESGRTLTNEKNQWRRLIHSSKIYHGLVKHYIINLIIWLGQRLSSVLSFCN